MLTANKLIKRQRNDTRTQEDVGGVNNFMYCYLMLTYLFFQAWALLIHPRSTPNDIRVSQAR